MVSPLTQAAVFLVLTISPGGEDVVRELLADVSGIGRSVGFRIPDGQLQVVAGIGSDAWSRLFDGPRPRELHPFLALEGDRHNSHVALNTITGPDGAERQIVRANMPFGNAGKGEYGTYYIGYAATPAVTEEMLANMFIGKPPGNTDRILDFSTAVTGCLFFAPCADFLDDPPGPPAVGGVPPGDGSLGLGSLRG